VKDYKYTKEGIEKFREESFHIWLNQLPPETFLKLNLEEFLRQAYFAGMISEHSTNKFMC